MLLMYVIRFTRERGGFEAGANGRITLRVPLTELYQKEIRILISVSYRFLTDDSFGNSE